MDQSVTFSPVHLSRGEVSVVLAADQFGSPVLLHWGASLGRLTPTELEAYAASRRPGVSHSALDYSRQTGLLTDTNAGFTGTPALEGFRIIPGAAGSPQLTNWQVREWQGGGTGTSVLEGVVLRGSDREAGWQVDVELGLSAHGMVGLRTTVTNTGNSELHVAAVRNSLPVGAHATELLDLTGRWCKERSPQRHSWVQGTFARSGRHGRTGHDATLLLIAGTPGFAFGHGELWAVHTAWSGNHTSYAERTPEGDCRLGGGELLSPGEVALAPAQSYASPWLLGSWSPAGLDAMSARLHGWIRDQSPLARTQRKIVVNTWEAVYFDHDLDRLKLLADRAAYVGAERFVLDDGWFRGRRHDRAGLGDWTVDAGVWPEGLHPLIQHVHSLGLDFGLWVEPEMVNVDSDVVREHPDWVLRGRDALPGEWRHQQVLDLQHPGAYAHVRDALLALLAEYDIAYLKWDHNRDLIDATHAGRAAAHGQTLALYALLDELRATHPRLEIESCASGGGRVDAEVLRRTDRIWPSDTIDALERQHIQRWTSLLVPPELMGSHLGGPVAHTTGRSHRLGFRAATGILFSWGFEWDLTQLSDDDLESVRRWVDVHRELRPIIASGTVVRPDHADPGVLVQGVVSQDRSTGWFVVAAIASTQTQHPAVLRLPGLDPTQNYKVRVRNPVQDHHRLDLAETWLDGDGLTLSGHVLGAAGIQLPVLTPDSALLLSAEPG